MILSGDLPPPMLAPRTVAEAVQALAARPDLTVVAGGTDAMVPVNDGRTTPMGWLTLHRVEELRALETRADGSTVIGAGVTMARLAGELGARHPALAQAARTVGSPQIRNAATLGGNVMTASPAGDTLPVLVAVAAQVELVSAGGSRTIPIADFLLGPKRHAGRPGELLRAVHLPPRHEHELFAKVGPRNAMVIAVCSLAVVCDDDGRAGVALGSVGPTVRPAPAAVTALRDPAGAESFADAVVAAVAPIDDRRGTARYRTHACAVLARRAHARIHGTEAAA